MFLEIIEPNRTKYPENANMNADTPAGMMMNLLAKPPTFVDDYLLLPEVKEAVRGNYIHIHDKDYYPTKSLTVCSIR